MKLDSAIVKLLLTLESPTQADLAKTLRVKPTAVAHSLSMLQKNGLVDLEREGTRIMPRLSLFRKIAEFEATISALRCTLKGSQ
jgi:predicted ArsR family transcriptional regulator